MLKKKIKKNFILLFVNPNNYGKNFYIFIKCIIIYEIIFKMVFYYIYIYTYIYYKNNYDNLLIKINNI